MNVRSGSGSLAFSIVSPACFAAISCADLEPSSPQFSNKLDSVGRAAGIESGRFSQYHRQAILSLCDGQEDRVEDLVDQGRISAREVGAIKRVIVVSDSTSAVDSGTSGTRIQPKVNATGTANAAVRKPTPDEAGGIDGAIDLLFARWAQTWFTDRYIRGSSHTLELAAKGTDYLVRGSFSFTRYGATATIPFASTLTRSGNFVVTNLCYNDTTSGMTDCTSSGRSSASSRMMGTVILGGIIAGMTGGNGQDSRSQSSDSYSADQARREREKDEAKSRRSKEAAQELKEYHEKMNEPNPYLDPPKSIN